MSAPKRLRYHAPVTITNSQYKEPLQILQGTWPQPDPDHEVAIKKRSTIMKQLFPSPAAYRTRRPWSSNGRRGAGVIARGADDNNARPASAD